MTETIQNAIKKLEARTGATITLSPDNERLMFKRGNDPFMVRVVFDEDLLTEDEYLEKLANGYEFSYENRPNVLKTDINQITNKSIILDNVIPHVIRTQRVEKYRKADIQVIAEPFLDLNVVYRVVIDDNHSFVVVDGILEHADITLDELKEAAKRNIYKQMDLKFMGEIIGAPANIVVITTQSKLYGSALITDTRALDKACEMLHANDIQIIPSSIHELLAVPWDNRLPDEVIVDVNERTVREDEQLSDHAYRYHNGQLT